MVVVVVVVVSAARRVHFSRGLPACWILPYLSTLGLGVLELVVGFIGWVSRAACCSSVGEGSRLLLVVSPSVVVISCADWGEIEADCSPFTGGLVGVLYGESMI